MWPFWLKAPPVTPESFPHPPPSMVTSDAHCGKDLGCLPQLFESDVRTHSDLGVVFTSRTLPLPGCPVNRLSPSQSWTFLGCSSWSHNRSDTTVGCILRTCQSIYNSLNSEFRLLTGPPFDYLAGYGSRRDPVPATKGN